MNDGSITLVFMEHIILLAHEFILINHIELLASRNRLMANTTCKTVYVKDSVFSSSHKISGGNTLIAP